MKIKVVVSLLIGMLFFINGFHQLWSLFFSAESLEITRGNVWSGFYIPFLDKVSQWLYLISCLGFAGLILASVVGFQTCKKLQLSKHNVTLAFLFAYIINKPIISGFLFFGYRNSLFENFSMHVLFLANFFLSVLTGTVFLILPLYIKYFKFANPGGTA
jgi:hypothetical protein